jgi:hypothetical protein
MPHPRQRDLLKAIQDHRNVIAACGRRFGKSRAVAAAGLHNLLLTPEADALVALGETRYALIVSNSREQSLILLEHARSLVSSSAALSHELVDDTEYELRFRGDRAFLAVPCNSRSIRGYAASFVAFDEQAHFVDESQGGPRVAQRLWAALTPSVAQFGPLGKVVCISTPSSDAGLFAELYAKARTGELGEHAAAFHAPTSANPAVDKAYLETQEAALGTDDFDREFNAIFSSGSAAFIEPERIRDCVQDWRECLPEDGTGWVASFDPAFSRDPSALALVGRSLDDPDHLIVGYTQRWTPPAKKLKVLRSRAEETSYIEAVCSEVAAVCVHFGLHSLITDQHLSGTMKSEFEKHGLKAIPRTWTKESKTNAFRSLRALIYTQRVSLPEDPVLLAEAGRLRQKGSDTIETPRSGDSHCDLIVAAAAGVLELERRGRSSPVRVTTVINRIQGRGSGLRRSERDLRRARDASPIRIEADDPFAEIPTFSRAEMEKHAWLRGRT